MSESSYRSYYPSNVWRETSTFGKAMNIAGYLPTVSYYSGRLRATRGVVGLAVHSSTHATCKVAQAFTNAPWAQDGAQWACDGYADDCYHGIRGGIEMIPGWRPKVVLIIYDDPLQLAACFGKTAPRNQAPPPPAAGHHRRRGAG